MAVLKGALRTVKGNRRSPIVPLCESQDMVHTVTFRGGHGILQSHNFTKILQQATLRARGHPPLANGREVPQAPQSIRGHPEPLQNNLCNKNNL